MMPIVLPNDNPHQPETVANANNVRLTVRTSKRDLLSKRKKHDHNCLSIGDSAAIQTSG